MRPVCFCQRTPAASSCPRSENIQPLEAKLKQQRTKATAAQAQNTSHKLYSGQDRGFFGGLNENTLSIFGDGLGLEHKWTHLTAWILTV